MNNGYNSRKVVESDQILYVESEILRVALWRVHGGRLPIPNNNFAVYSMTSGADHRWDLGDALTQRRASGVMVFRTEAL